MLNAAESTIRRVFFCDSIPEIELGGYPHLQKSQLKLSRDSRLLNQTLARVALQIHD